MEESLGVGIIIIFFVIIFAMIAVWVYAIVDIAKNDFEGDNKMIWLLIVILVGFLGAIIYFIVGREKKIPKGSNDETSYTIDN